jgi:hypothetical protein
MLLLLNYYQFYAPAGYMADVPVGVWADFITGEIVRIQNGEAAYCFCHTPTT